ncbi:MAG: glycosyltransferase family 39 protein [Nitrosomonadales bacterium]|nr:glycosyltransferase family 39 protein [Nitrosomonadales bacterium]
MTNDISRRGLWLLLLAVALIWFGNLEYRKLVKPDEGRYAEIPREMVVSGDWTTPRLNELKYFEKPPLQYWATAIAYEVFGEHQWTSRLWAALTGFAGVLLAWFAGTRLFGRQAGIYAALLLGGSMLYSMMAHINTLDMGVTFFISLGIFALLIAQKEQQPARRRHWMWLAWAGLALAVLSKGLMGLVLPGAALFLYSVFNRDITVWKRMHWFTGLAVFLLIAAPWFVLVIKANPEFFDRFFIYEHYTRFTTTVHGRYQPWYYFVPVLTLGMLPWTFLMFDTLLRSWRSGARVVKVFSPERFLLVWVVFIYFFFSISGSKLPSYLLPMFPALALLMGKQVAEMESRRLFWLVLPVLLIVAIMLGLAPFTAKTADTPLQLELYSAFAVWLTVAAAVWFIGVIAGLWLLRRDNKMTAVIVLAFSALIAGQIGTSGHNTAARDRSAYHVAEAIMPYVKPDIPFYSILYYEQTLPFYIKRTFTLVQYQDEMDFGIRQEPEKWIPDLAGFAERWNKDKEALAIVQTHQYSEVEALHLPMKEIFRDEHFVVVMKP